MASEPQFVRMYDFQENLGKGHFAVVKRAQHVLSKEQVAVKIIDKLKLTQDELDHIHHEVRVMKLINHPHIIRLYQVVDTHKSLYLILELGMGGDLYEYIQKNGKLDEHRAKLFFRQLVAAIVYCHSLHIVHRDLKAENVIFTDADTIKITDFGLSNNFLPGQKMMTACGSLAYSAPEMLLQEPYDGPSVDIWSLGIILYMMIVGRLPFQDANESSTVFKILDVNYTTPDFVSNGVRDLLAQILVRDHEKRLNGDQVAAHRWLATVSSARSANWVREIRMARASQETISPEEHESILQTMTSHDMDRKAVIDSLASNQYDHITSTYYLLAQKQRRLSFAKFDTLSPPLLSPIHTPANSFGSRPSPLLSFSFSDTPSGFHRHSGTPDQFRVGSLHARAEITSPISPKILKSTKSFHRFPAVPTRNVVSRRANSDATIALSNDVGDDDVADEMNPSQMQTLLQTKTTNQASHMCCLC